LNFSGKLYKVVPYNVRKEDERIDYDEVERLAKEHRPKLIVAGASAYPRIIDFARSARSRTWWARCSWWIWRTFQAWWQRVCIPTPASTRTS